MAGLTGFIRNVRRVVGLQKAGDLPDAQLLKDFISERDEAAFEAIVDRAKSALADKSKSKKAA